MFIVGGGTAGHVLPALTVARALLAGGSQQTVHFVGSRRGMEGRLVTEAGFTITLLPGRGIVRRMSITNVVAIAGLLVACARSLVLVMRFRPVAVVAVGGYAAVPCSLAAALCRRPVIVVNLDSVAGAANRLIGRFARVCAVAYPGTRLPHAVVTGAPVRQEVLALERTADGRAAARRVLGLDPQLSVIAVTGGSLGAKRLNDGALGLAELLADRSELLIYHVCGARDFAALERRVALSDAIKSSNYRLVAFETHLPELFCVANLVICRAGASTVAELCALGTPSVLVPLPNAPGDHQLHNAEDLVNIGGSTLVLDADATPPRLAREVVELIDQPLRLEAMGSAAHSLSHREAAREIADLVIATIKAPRHGTVPEEHPAQGSAA